MADALRQTQATNADRLPAAGPEQRTAKRFTLLIRAAKIISANAEFLCVIRDASATGLAVSLFHKLPDQSRFIIEFQNGDRVEAMRVWESEGRAGFHFDNPADIVRIIESPSKFSKRPMRIALERSGMLHAGLNAYEVEMVNISQQGAMVNCKAQLEIDRKVRLKVQGLPELQAKVRWRGGGQTGLVFENTLQLSELAALVAAFHGLPPILAS